MVANPFDIKIYSDDRIAVLLSHCIIGTRADPPHSKNRNRRVIGLKRGVFCEPCLALKTNPEIPPAPVQFFIARGERSCRKIRERERDGDHYQPLHIEPAVGNADSRHNQPELAVVAQRKGGKQSISGAQAKARQQEEK